MVFLIIILFVLLIIVHEYGHFIAARRNGVDVEEFGIGFPPKLYGKKPKNSETEYSINLLPLGGFVRLKGESSSDNAKGTFGGADLWTKTKILMAGVGMNLAAAFIILTGLALFGIPQFIENQFTVPADETITQDRVIAVTVNESFPLSKAGVESGDTIKRIGDFEIEESQQLFELGDEFVGKEAEVEFVSDEETITKVVQFPGQEELANLVVEDYLREQIVDEEGVVFNVNSLAGQEIDGNLAEIVEENIGKTVSIEYTIHNGITADIPEPKTADIELSSEEVEPVLKLSENSGPFGITPTDVTVKRYTWSAPLVGLGLTLQLTWLTFAGVLVTIGHLFTGAVEQASQNVTGPIGIFVLLNQFTALGVSFVLYFMAVISVALAVMNALPIPALDGGRLALIAGFKAFKKELTEKIESRVHTVGFVALMLLVVLLSYVDINRFF